VQSSDAPNSRRKREKVQPNEKRSCSFLEKPAVFICCARTRAQTMSYTSEHDLFQEWQAMIDKANQAKEECNCAWACICLTDFDLPAILSAAQTAVSEVPGAQEIIFSDPDLLHTLCDLRLLHNVPKSTELIIEDLCRALVKYNTSGGRTFRSYSQAPKLLFPHCHGMVDAQVLFDFAQSSSREDAHLVFDVHLSVDCLTGMALAQFGYTDRILQWLGERHSISLLCWLNELLECSEVRVSDEQIAKISALAERRFSLYGDLIDTVFFLYTGDGIPPGLFVNVFESLVEDLHDFEGNKIYANSLLPFAGPLAQAHAQTHTFYSYEIVQELLQWVVLSRGVEIAIGLQSLRLPVLLLNMILDEHLPLDPPTMHRKWLYLKAVRHWHQRQER
jgi:hypothetical protein